MVNTGETKFNRSEIISGRTSKRIEQSKPNDVFEWKWCNCVWKMNPRLLNHSPSISLRYNFWPLWGQTRMKYRGEDVRPTVGSILILRSWALCRVPGTTGRGDENLVQESRWFDGCLSNKLRILATKLNMKREIIGQKWIWDIYGIYGIWMDMGQKLSAPKFCWFWDQHDEFCGIRL